MSVQLIYLQWMCKIDKEEPLINSIYYISGWPCSIYLWFTTGILPIAFRVTFLALNYDCRDNIEATLTDMEK